MPMSAGLFHTYLLVLSSLLSWPTTIVLEQRQPSPALPYMPFICLALPLPSPVLAPRPRSATLELTVHDNSKAIVW